MGPDAVDSIAVDPLLDAHRVAITSITFYCLPFDKIVDVLGIFYEHYLHCRALFTI